MSCPVFGAVSPLQWGESVATNMDIKIINRNIKTIRTNGAKLDALIHSTAVGCLVHCQAHGDCTPMDQLLEALPKASRIEAFKVWVQTFSPIRWNGDGKVGVAKEGTKLYVPFDIEQAEKVPYWALTEEKVKVKELNAAALVALINRFVKQVDEANEAGEVVHDGVLKAKVTDNVVELKAFAHRVAEAAALKAA